MNSKIKISSNTADLKVHVSVYSVQIRRVLFLLVFIQSLILIAYMNIGQNWSVLNDILMAKQVNHSSSVLGQSRSSWSRASTPMSAPPPETLAPTTPMQAPPPEIFAPPPKTSAPPPKTLAPPPEIFAPPPETFAPPIEIFAPLNETLAPSTPASSPIPLPETTSLITPILEGPDQSCGHFLLYPNGGRLGNQLFLYASFYGIVRKQYKSRKINFITQNVYWLDDIFQNLTFHIQKLPKVWFDERGFTRLYEPKCSGYDGRVIEDLRCDGKNYILDGCRQSFKYFHDVDEELRKELTFKTDIVDKSKKLLDDSFGVNGWMKANCVSIGVHLRRGDYARESYIRKGYWPAQFDYFQRAVTFYETQFYQNSTNPVENGTRLIFIIFGDDYEWNLNVTEQVRLIDPDKSRFVLVNGNDASAEVVLCTMSLCDHGVISTGTFSWWAGYFNRGMVTYQKEYARNGSWIYDQYVKEDYYYPHWIPL